MQNAEQKLAEQIGEIAKLAKDNKGVDVSALMANVLENHQKNLIPSSRKRWAYLVSIGAPPFGLIFALKFYFSDADDGRESAYACIVLTIISLVLVYWFTTSLFSATHVTPQQIEQIKPKDIFELTQ